MSQVIYGNRIKIFPSNLFEVVILLLYVQMQSPSFNYDLYSHRHHCDSSRQKETRFVTVLSSSVSLEEQNRTMPIIGRLTIFMSTGSVKGAGCSPTEG